MEFFNNTKFDFIGKRTYYFAFSLGLFALATFGFIKNGGPIKGLEFTGGTLVQIGFKELPPIDKIRGTLNKAGWQGFSLQTQPVDHSIIVRVKGQDDNKDTLATDLLKALRADYPENVKPAPDRVEFIGPVIGRQLMNNTYKAIFWSLVMILIYVAFRFSKFVWGFSGVLALTHDVYITWGVMTLLGHETTLVVVAALLTLAGYSINDTIVIFDRVRENLRTARKETTAEIYNRSLNETFSRTVNTSMTTLLASLSLLVWGGEVIHDFAFAMFFGLFIGAYSTVGVALTLVYQIESRRKAH